MSHEIQEADFEGKVLKSSLPVIVDFMATWCPPCKMLAPVIEKIAEEYSGKVDIFSVNTDDCPGLAGKFSITGVPTLIFFKNGEEVNRLVGYKDYRALKAEVDKLG